MVDIIRFFKKEDRLASLHSFLSHSFLKVKYDMEHIFEWMHYFREKHEQHDYHNSLLKQELGEHRNSIVFLNQEIKELKKQMSMLTTDASKKAQDAAILQTNRSQMSQGQLRTTQDISGTTQGQLRDNSNTEKNAQKQQKIQIIDKSSFTGSQLEVLNLLYHSEKPLSYENIAVALGKKEKSIRNSICEIRNKGINILGKSIGSRTKGFFLDRQEKIKVSGR